MTQPLLSNQNELPEILAATSADDSLPGNLQQIIETRTRDPSTSTATTVVFTFPREGLLSGDTVLSFECKRNSATSKASLPLWAGATAAIRSVELRVGGQTLCQNQDLPSYYATMMHFRSNHERAKVLPVRTGSYSDVQADVNCPAAINAQNAPNPGQIPAMPAGVVGKGKVMCKTDKTIVMVPVEVTTNEQPYANMSVGDKTARNRWDFQRNPAFELSNESLIDNPQLSSISGTPRWSIKLSTLFPGLFIGAHLPLGIIEQDVSLQIYLQSNNYEGEKSIVPQSAAGGWAADGVYAAQNFKLHMDLLFFNTRTDVEASQSPMERLREQLAKGGAIPLSDFAVINAIAGSGAAVGAGTTRVETTTIPLGLASQRVKRLMIAAQPLVQSNSNRLLGPYCSEGSAINNGDAMNIAINSTPLYEPSITSDAGLFTQLNYCSPEHFAINRGIFSCYGQVNGNGAQTEQATLCNKRVYGRKFSDSMVGYGAYRGINLSNDAFGSGTLISEATPVTLTYTSTAVQDRRAQKELRIFAEIERRMFINGQGQVSWRVA
jgi:hypothetical protein